jgi:hypothetical protein
VPASSIGTVRATTNGNDPVLLPGNLVPEMIVFPPTSTLAVGGSIQVSGLKVKALQLGDVTITCHVHAEADQNFLFPSDRNRDDSTDFEVV